MDLGNTIYAHENQSHLKRCFIFILRMIVHNEGDEDQDIKELFQNVFKPFWAAVPVVSD